MTNSDKVTRDLKAAVQKMNQALRASGTSRPDPQSAADCFNRLVAAISNIDQRLVAIEKAQEANQVSAQS